MRVVADEAGALLDWGVGHGGGEEGTVMAIVTKGGAFGPHKRILLRGVRLMAAGATTLHDSSMNGTVLLVITLGARVA